MSLPAAVLDDLLAFADALGVSLYPWQREAFGEAVRREGGRFRYRLAGVSVPRGNGKSYAGALVGLWRLLAGPPPQDIISAALGFTVTQLDSLNAEQLETATTAIESAIADKQQLQEEPF